MSRIRVCKPSTVLNYEKLFVFSPKYLLQLSNAARARQRFDYKDFYCTDDNMSCETCKKIRDNLSALPPYPSEAHRLVLDNPLKDRRLAACMNAMEDVRLSDLGFGEQLEEWKSSVCATIYRTKQFNIAAFLIPKGRGLPLHNHPNMAVLSKVIYGSLELESYTLDNTSDKSSGVIRALLTKKEIKTSKDSAWFLTPNRDNVHSFYALSTCVILDCILPPYLEPDRPCEYFEATATESGDWVLRSVPEDTEAIPIAIPYRGEQPV